VHSIVESLTPAQLRVAYAQVSDHEVDDTERGAALVLIGIMNPAAFKRITKIAVRSPR